MVQNPNFRTKGQDHQGEWLVQRPDTKLNEGLMCCGTWKSEEDAKDWCRRMNSRANYTFNHED